MIGAERRCRLRFSELFTIFVLRVGIPGNGDALEILFSVFEVELVALRFQDLAELRRAAEEHRHLKREEIGGN